MKHWAETLTLIALALLLVLPSLWLPTQSVGVDSGELIWVVGVAVQNALLLLGLAWVTRSSPATRRAALGQTADARTALPLAALLLAVYALDLALLWWGFADGDPMVLDRAAVVIFSAALLTGPRVAIPLGTAAIVLRLGLVWLTDDNGFPAVDAHWPLDYAWALLEPGVLFLPAGITAALLLRRAACQDSDHAGDLAGDRASGQAGDQARDQASSGCPLWTAFALATVAETAYLAAAWQQWGWPDWARYLAAEAFADAFAMGLSIALLLLLLRGLRGDLEHTRAQATELALARERLQALRAQTQPHFLFNALNTIHSRIAEDPEHARELLLDLSDLLRSVLSERDSHTTLARELSFVRNYAALEQARFGDRLDIKYAIQAQCESLSVPVLVLQPLVENAIKHGIAPYISGGRVTISAHCDSKRLRIEVRDQHHESGGQPATPQTSTGTGLDNLRQRLQLLYGDNARLLFDHSPEDGCRVTVELPP